MTDHTLTFWSRLFAHDPEDVTAEVIAYLPDRWSNATCEQQGVVAWLREQIDRYEQETRALDMRTRAARRRELIADRCRAGLELWGLRSGETARALWTACGPCFIENPVNGKVWEPSIYD